MNNPIQVGFARTETVVYYVTIDASLLRDDDNNYVCLEDLAFDALEANDWTCERKGKGGNCIDAEHFIVDDGGIE